MVTLRVEIIQPGDAVPSRADNHLYIGYLNHQSGYDAVTRDNIQCFVQLQRPDNFRYMAPLLALEHAGEIEFDVDKNVYTITGGPVPNVDTLLDDAMHITWDPDRDLVQQILFGRCRVNVKKRTL